MRQHQRQRRRDASEAKYFIVIEDLIDESVDEIVPLDFGDFVFQCLRKISFSEMLGGEVEKEERAGILGTGGDFDKDLVVNRW